MFGSGAKLLGPVARRLVSPARWTDEYPAWPAYAKELDALLLFADEQGRLSQFVPRLESRNTQRDEALNELRVAYWFHHNKLPILGLRQNLENVDLNTSSRYSTTLLHSPA